MHQHTRQTLELVPLLAGWIVIQAGGWVRLGHKVATFIAGNEEATRCRAIERLRRACGFAQDKRRGGGLYQIIQRFGADRAQQDVNAVELAGVGALNERIPVAGVAKVDQSILQPHAVVGG